MIANSIFILGRYGDPLNPWGDILAMAEAWCVSSPQVTMKRTLIEKKIILQTKLLLGVPTSVSLNKDWITFNAHRIYGPLLYPFLVIKQQAERLKVLNNAKILGGKF